MHGIDNLIYRVPSENLRSIFRRPSTIGRGRSGGEDSRRGGIRVRVRVLTGKERGVVAEDLGEGSDEID